MASFDLTDAALVLPAWRSKARAWGLALVGAVVLACALDLGWLALQAFAMVATVVGVLTGLHLGSKRATTRPVELKADSSGVWLDGRLAIARDALRTGYLEPRVGTTPLLHLVGKSRRERVTLVLQDAERGARVLQALGLDRSRSLSTFRVRAGVFSSKKAQSFVAAMAMALRFSYLWWRPFGAFWWLALPVLALLAVNLAWPTHISVGADGVLVKGLLRRTFHPFAKITHVRRTSWGVLLVRENGREVEIRTEGKENGKASPSRDALFACVEKRVAQLAAVRGETHAAALLARGGRSVEEWTRALRTLGSEQVESYRALALPAEEMWRILEDPSSDATARAGAAVALRGSLDEEGRARVLAVADQCASPRVRVALHAAAVETAEVGALERALEACDEEEEPESQRARARG